MRWLVPPGSPTGPWQDSYAWPAARYVRACMVMTLDGSVTGPDGLSGSISSGTDRAVLSAVRRFADAYLVGAETVRAEGYGPVRARQDTVGPRAARGQAAAPTLAIVSASCRFDWDEARFQHSDNRPVVLTTHSSDPRDRAAAASRCDVIVVGRDRVEPRDALDALAERGLTRVTCEGGDRLLSQMARAHLLDEVDLTVSPVLTAAARDGRPGPAVLDRMRLAQLLERDGYLFARYVRS